MSDDALGVALPPEVPDEVPVEVAAGVPALLLLLLPTSSLKVTVRAANGDRLTERLPLPLSWNDQTKAL